MHPRAVLSRFWDLHVWGQFAIFATILVSCVAVLLIAAYHTASVSREAAARVQNTQEVIDAADQAVSAMVDMETGYRGFLLTGQVDFLQPFEAGRESFARQMNTLETDQSQPPDELQRWAEVRRLVWQWEWQVTIPGIQQRMQMSMGNDTLDDVINGQTAAKARLDAIRQLVAEGTDAQRAELIQQTDAAEAVNAQLQTLLVWGGLITVLLAVSWCVFVAHGIKRNLQRLIRANERVMQGDLAHRMEPTSQNEFGQVATAFDRMAHELQANRDRQEAMLVVFRRFALEDNSERVLSHLVEAAVEFTRADGAAVYRSDASRGGLVRVGSAGVHALEPEFLGSDVGVVASAIELRQAQIENTALPEMMQAGATACAFAPLIFEGETLGGLLAWTGQGSWGFSEVDASTFEILGAVGAATLARREHTHRLRKEAETDVLTGLYNRRKGFERLQALVDKAAASGECMSLALIDLDHFKSMNDGYGHEVGDHALRRVGTLLSRALGPDDVAARWGGEEFVVGMYGVGTREAVARLEALLHQMTAGAGEAMLRIGFSAGVADYPRTEVSLPALLRAADGALYSAKRAGRSRIMVGTSSSLDEDLLAA